MSLPFCCFVVCGITRLHFRTNTTSCFGGPHGTCDFPYVHNHLQQVCAIHQKRALVQWLHAGLFAIIYRTKLPPPPTLGMGYVGG